MFVAGRFQLWIHAQSTTDARNATFFDPSFDVVREFIPKASDRVMIFFYDAILKCVGSVDRSRRQRKLRHRVLVHKSCLNIVHDANESNGID